MKRVGYLFERIVSTTNLRLAFVKASRGKRCRSDQVDFMRNLDTELARLREGLLAGDYPVGNYKRFTIWEPKEREICAAAFGERVLHHALMNVCEPYFDKWLIFDSYACRQGKGQLKAVQRAAERAGRHAWFLKGDFRKYFDSIPHDRLMAVLEQFGQTARSDGDEPGHPRRQLEQQRAELPLREPQQEPAVQPQQQPGLPPLLLRSTAGWKIARPPQPACFRKRNKRNRRSA